MPYRWHIVAVWCMGVLAAAIVSGQTPISLEIKGPSVVGENFHAMFTAVARYDDASTGDVTSLAAWGFTSSTQASFASPGSLTTGEIGSCEKPGTVSATYSEGQTELTVVWGVTLLPTGGAGSALLFDGVDDVAQVPDSASFNWDTQITIEFWLKADPSAGYGRVLAKGDGLNGNSNRCFDVDYEARDSPPHTVIAEVFLGQTTYAVIPAYGGAQPGQWVHLAFTLDSAISTQHAYVNGQIVSEGGQVAQLPIRHSTYPVEIGGNLTYPSLKGALDEVRIWTVARTTQEIQDAMYQRLSGNEPGLVLYWRLDEGAGQVVHDTSPHHNDGYLGSSSSPDGRDPVWIGSDSPLGPPPLVHDCNGNGIEDECDIASGSSPDCNGNGIPDQCDVASGASADANGDGIPDECEGGKGDMNCDGVVNGQDIDGFVYVLFGVAPSFTEYYDWAGPGCNHLNGDMTGDGVVNGLDIDPFVAALFGG